MPLSLTEQTLIFLAFFAAFAVKGADVAGCTPGCRMRTWRLRPGGSVVAGGDHAQEGRVWLPGVSPCRSRPDASRELDWLIIALSLSAVVIHRFRGAGSAAT